MVDGLLAVIVVVLFIVSAAALARRRAGPRLGDAQGLPAELRAFEIAHAEASFGSRRLRLAARVDRAYRTPTGLTLVELKTRTRDAVYMSDVIELSVQRIALEDDTGEAVSAIAWVLLQDPSTAARRAHKVRLLSSDEVAAMRDRYRAIVGGRAVIPTPARSSGQCSHCAHARVCAATYRDRG